MIDKNINIIGVGGHAKIVFEIASFSNYVIEGFYDDNKSFHHNRFCGIEVKGSINLLSDTNSIIAIGNNNIRKDIAFKVKNINWISLIHPQSIISSSVEIGNGCLISAGAIIQSCSIIGEHCIVNTNSSIDHDCKLGDFVHVSPSATLCGNVIVGEGTQIGAGATIIPNVKIGNWCVIGAGSVIIKDIPDFSVVVGVPGEVIKNLSRYDSK